MIKKMKIGKSKQCCSICANLFAKGIFINNFINEIRHINQILIKMKL